MTEPAPIYSSENCSFSYPLQWVLSVFWRTPTGEDDWLEELGVAVEPDGIRILGHRFAEPGTSQFTISTKPNVAPRLIVQRVKGRLQYLIRDKMPKPWRRNFAIRSVGCVTREDVENYIVSQLDHLRMADPQVQARLERIQIVLPDVDLSQPQRTSHGLFWYNLHLVFVHGERFAEIRDDTLSRVGKMVLRASAAKRYLLSRGGILPDHVHLALGCPFDVAPGDVAIGFLNNLSYVHGMKALFQYGGFLGTFGEYTNRALTSTRQLRTSFGDGE